MSLWKKEAIKILVIKIPENNKNTPHEAYACRAERDCRVLLYGWLPDYRRLSPSQDGNAEIKAAWEHNAMMLQELLIMNAVIPMVACT